MKPWTKETPRDYSRAFGRGRKAEVFLVLSPDFSAWVWRLCSWKRDWRTIHKTGESKTAATAKASAMRAAKRLGWLSR